MQVQQKVAGCMFGGFSQSGGGEGDAVRGCSLVQVRSHIGGMPFSHRTCPSESASGQWHFCKELTGHTVECWLDVSTRTWIEDSGSSLPAANVP